MTEYVLLPPTTEQVIYVAPEQLMTVRYVMSRKPDYDRVVELVRSLGVEPNDNVTYRFVLG